MRHYVAVEDENGRWFYANEGRHRETGRYGWTPSGACTQRPLKTCPACGGKKFTDAAFKDCSCSFGLVEDPDVTPCQGHASAEEAYEHERQRILATQVRFWGANDEEAHQLHRCQAEGCGKFTSGYASAGGYRHWTLCPEHQTREAVEPLLRVGESWES